MKKSIGQIDMNARYSIYGVNRVAKDFIYVFKTLSIICFFEDDQRIETFLGKPVYNLSDYREKDGTFDQIIVCGFEHSAQIAQLDRTGLVYGDDYLLEEDFFEQLDENHINPNRKKIAVWGTGKRADHFWKECGSTEVAVVIDSNPHIHEYKGHSVYHPNNVRDWEDYFVIIAVADDSIIRQYLEKKGFSEFTDYVTSLTYEMLPSRLLAVTIFDQNEYDLNCMTMLNHIEVGGNDGNMITCCSTFNSSSIGRLRKTGFDLAWNSLTHRILCLSNLNRTYSFCDKLMCPLFIGRRLCAAQGLDVPYQEMKPYPSTVAISMDYTCNLKCITCRKEYRGAKGVEQEQINKISDYVKENLLPHTEFLIAAGDGEVFLSKAYRSIYTHPNMKFVKWLRFLTNGLLFTPEKWKELREVYQGKVMMTVSIDAATKETYEKIRSGGKFEVLERNMEYAASLRKTGDLSYLRFNFVVQRENYREMPMFVKWGQTLGIDELFFTKILNWGTYTAEEFSEISMMETDGITPKVELEAILNRPEMQSKEVDLGTIRSHHERVSEDVIVNYYRWELERKVPGLFAIEGK